jgi:hypothetical protein
MDVTMEGCGEGRVAMAGVAGDALVHKRAEAASSSSGASQGSISEDPPPGPGAKSPGASPKCVHYDSRGRIRKKPSKKQTVEHLWWGATSGSGIKTNTKKMGRPNREQQLMK